MKTLHQLFMNVFWNLDSCFNSHCTLSDYNNYILVYKTGNQSKLPNYPLFFVFLNVLRLNYTVLRPPQKKDIGPPWQIVPYKVGYGKEVRCPFFRLSILSLLFLTWIDHNLLLVQYLFFTIIDKYLSK